MSDRNTDEIRLHGMSASPGISIGKAYLVDKEGVDVVEKYLIKEKQIKNETNRFKAAVKKSKDELDSIIDDTPEELKQHASILETQKVLLKDKLLFPPSITLGIKNITISDFVTLFTWCENKRSRIGI